MISKSPERGRFSLKNAFLQRFLQTLSKKILKRLNRQITWGIKVCFLHKKYNKARILIQTKILPAELITAKMLLIKFHYDKARQENSENFHRCLCLQQHTKKTILN